MRATADTSITPKSLKMNRYDTTLKTEYKQTKLEKYHLYNEKKKKHWKKHFINSQGYNESAIDFFPTSSQKDKRGLKKEKKKTPSVFHNAPYCSRSY